MGSSIFTAFLASIGMGKICCSLLIQLSVDHFGSYSNALMFMSVFPLSTAVILLLLSSPLYDKLRSIESAMGTTGSRLDASAVHEKMKKHKYLERATVSSLALFFFVFGFVRSGMFVHISVYCEEYLMAKASMSRYLLSIYAL